ncbi:hypothetical protein BGX38DRAFT_1270267 [Terfezia claveryi]|nr:hypothetical protein BGX38DRAFT_1270267 [Terfezia claveryi]
MTTNCLVEDFLKAELTDFLKLYGFLTYDDCNDERLVGSQQPEHLQTRAQHHEIALAVHIKNIYSNLGGTTITTLSPSIEAFSPLPRSSSSSLSQKSPLTGIGPRFRESTHTKSAPANQGIYNSHTAPNMPQRKRKDNPGKLDKQELFNSVTQFREVAFSLRCTLVDWAAEDTDLDQWDFCSLPQIKLIEKKLNVESNEKETLQEAANRHSAGLVQTVYSLQAPPPPPLPTSTTDTSTQTTPPTPAQKPMTNLYRPPSTR